MKHYVRHRGTALTEIEERQGGGWQDPAMELLARALEADEVALGPVAMELRPFQTYGVPITVEIMRKAIERAKEQFGPPKPMPVEPRRRVTRGPFGGTEYVGRAVVYYMRIGNRVKIGTTGQLGLRLSSINPEELMATEPGDIGRERSRHAQFKALRTHGEWFRLESPLVEHIEKLREAAKAKRR